MPISTFLARRFQSKGPAAGIRLVARLAILGIALGVATLLLTQSVLSGFEKVFKESLMGFSAHVAVLRYGGIPDPKNLQKQMNDQWGEELAGATPFFYRESLLVAGGKVRGAALKGIDPAQFEEVYGLQIKPWEDFVLSEGAWQQSPEAIQALLLSPSEAPPLLLGEDLAKSLGVGREQNLVKVFLPKQGTDSEKALHRFENFRVVGTFNAGLKELDAGFALVDQARLAQVFGEDTAASSPATGLEFRLHDPERAPMIAAAMEEALGPGYEVYSWQQMNEPLFHALRLERVLFFVLMAMVVAVAAFNVIGVLLLMIFEKKKEISILRALGLSLARLKKIWLLQGLGLGLLGALGGLILASVLGLWLKNSQAFRLAKEVYWVENLPLEASATVALSVLGASLLLIGLASLFALRQLKKAPLQL